ncbi:MAG: aminoacyl-tRNA hydrolase [Arachnia sp.]
MTAFLVVGLGNPGPTYATTRHNVGFLAVDDLADRLGASFANQTRHWAMVASGQIPAAPGVAALRLVMVKPTTFMNDSGRAVRAIATFHKIPVANVVVIHDELDLDPGRLRVKLGGGDNGHNGLRSIRQHLGTGDFARVRVGIGRPPGRQPAADYVLARLTRTGFEELLVDAAVAADAAESYCAQGLEATQNQFNR